MGEKVSVSFTRSEYSTFEHELERMYNAEFVEIDEGVDEYTSIKDRHAEEIVVKTTILKDEKYQLGYPLNIIHHSFQTTFTHSRDWTKI